MNRRGDIIQTPFETDTVLEYLKFIQKIDKVDKWEDLKPISNPINNLNNYEIPWDLINKLTGKGYGIADLITNIETANRSAPILGARYSYLRMEQQGVMIELVEQIAKSIKHPLNFFIEPGCFTGGLLNFLAYKYPNSRTIGLDISPISLDLASNFASAIGHNDRTHWLEVDFGLVKAELLTPVVGFEINRPVVLISNMLTYLGMPFENSPGIDKWHVKAGLISYWVNLGALVVVSERHNDPDALVDTLMKNGRWEYDKTKAVILKDWVGFSTINMTDESPMGEWNEYRMCVIAFHRDFN